MEAGGIIDQNGGFWTEDIELYQQVKSRYSFTSTSDWWGGAQKNWSLTNVFPQRHKAQSAFIEEYFMPYLNVGQSVCDLASANGEWSFLIADKAGHVDGYEYSIGMVETARERAKELGISNVTFQQADAIQMQFEKQYDNFMMLGLLTCIEKESDAEHIVRKVYDAMKPGARLIVKDTLKQIDEDVVYKYTMANRYTAVYRSKEKYYDLYLKAGFELQNDAVLETVEIESMIFCSVMCMWIKR